jgi:hypothetical protein
MSLPREYASRGTTQASTMYWPAGRLPCAASGRPAPLLVVPLCEE